MVMAIGGADMPVVVSMLNSYSGWAAAATGFMLSNDLLIVTGALVGSSGAILSYIMCRAMNRSIFSVIARRLRRRGGRASRRPARQPAGEVHRDQRRRDRGAAARRARTSSSCPGYGMAVAQAQHTVYEITEAAAREGRQRALRASTRSPAACPAT